MGNETYCKKKRDATHFDFLKTTKPPKKWVKECQELGENIRMKNQKRDFNRLIKNAISIDNQKRDINRFAITEN